jgi:hypothetical protein
MCVIEHLIFSILQANNVDDCPEDIFPDIFPKDNCSTEPGQLPASRQDSAQLPKGQGISSRGRVCHMIKLEIKKYN